jgi:hypothetical protein
LYSSSHVDRLSTSRRMMWLDSVHIRERTGYGVLVGKQEGKIPFIRPGLKVVYNIKRGVI